MSDEYDSIMIRNTQNVNELTEEEREMLEISNNHHEGLESIIDNYSYVDQNVPTELIL